MNSSQDSDKATAPSPSSAQVDTCEARQSGRGDETCIVRLDDRSEGAREERLATRELSAEPGKIEPDATTGASPGTAQACDDLGLNSLEANLKRLGIKPPGQS